MGIGSALVFIAIGAILAFATHVHVSGIDLRMVGWILIFVGVAMLAITFAYTRPRARRRELDVAENAPGAYISQVDEPPSTVWTVEGGEPDRGVRPATGRRRDVR